VNTLKNSPLTFQTKDVSIELNIRGINEYTKLSYPVKYGIFSRLETCDHVFEFNLNHEIKSAKSKSCEWRNPQEWLKRTMGNDWVYYSTGGYSGVVEALGEYYLPNLTYPTNSLLGGKPFKEYEIDNIVKNFHDIIPQVPNKIISDKNMPDAVATWLNKVKQQTPAVL
jgi:hypothetical protein